MGFGRNCISLVGTNFVGKLLSFIIHSVTLRYVNPSVYGLVFLKFDLWMTIVLCISREPLKIWLLRQKNIGREESFVFWIFSLMISVPLMSALSLSTFNNALGASWLFYACLFVHILCIFADLLIEPFGCFIMSKIDGSISTRMFFENVGMAAKSLSILYILIRGGDKLENVLLSQLIGQVIVTISILILICARYFQLIWDLCTKIKKENKNTMETWNAFREIRPIVFQEALKYISAQSEQLAANLILGFEEQSIYMIVVNYAGIALRLISVPIEQSFTLYATKYFSKSKQEKIDRIEGDQETIQDIEEKFLNIVQLYQIFFFAAISHGTFLVSPLVRLVLGADWSNTSVPRLLAFYCWLLPFLATSSLFTSLLDTFLVMGEWQEKYIYFKAASFVVSFVGSGVFGRYKGILGIFGFNIFMAIIKLYISNNWWIRYRMMDSKSNSINGRNGFIFRSFDYRLLSIYALSYMMHYICFRIDVIAGYSSLVLTSAIISKYLHSKYGDRLLTQISQPLNELSVK